MTTTSRQPGSSAQVGIVTGGAGGGIGQGIARALAQQGWSLLLVDVDKENLSALAQQLEGAGAAVEIISTDITFPGAAESAVALCMRRFGRLDGLVNSAGVGLCKAVGDTTDAEFDRLLDTDLRAAFRFSRAALPALLATHGAIVSVGSVHATRSMFGYGAYATAKAGLEALMRGIAIDYGARGVRANTVHPGLVVSPQTHTLLSTFVADPEAWIMSYESRKQLLPAVVSAEQIGEAVAWLLSPRAAAITGQAITVDAGTSAMLYNRETT